MGVSVWHDPSPYADDHELKLCTLQKLVGHINLTWVIRVALASSHI